MKIAVLKERRLGETRVALSPDTAKRYISQGIEVVIETEAGHKATFKDEAYEAVGATIGATPSETVAQADIILKIQTPMLVQEGHDEIALFSSGQILACYLEALERRDIVDILAEKGVTSFAMELMPRITRAQSMDILSSQSNVAGYKAVLDGLEHYGRVVPLMMTAAGTIQPARVFIMGVGVAGLQAIATAKRLGAIVSATDVRPATKEQVESLGAEFVAVENEEFEQAQSAGGYAKQMSDDYKRQQAELIADVIKKQDIVITTALIPGRKAPVLVTKEMIESMKPGTVIVDMAAVAGGNVEGSQKGEITKINDVTLVGYKNMPARVAETTSNLFAKNLLTFVLSLWNKDEQKLNIDREDDIIKGVLVTYQGHVVHPRLAPQKEEDTFVEQETKIVTPINETKDNA